MRSPVTYIIGALCIVIVVLSLSVVTRPVTAETKEAYPPEAITLVESIKQSSQKYSAAEKDAEAAEKILKEALDRKLRAAAAAKGADLTLCANFQLKFDRATQKIVKDSSCPLL